MKLATSTGDFGFLNNCKESIQKIYEAGFKYIDLSMYSDYEINYIMQNGWEDAVADILTFAENLGMKFVQAHSPDFDGLCRNYSFNDAVKITERSFEVCRMLGIRNTVVHSRVGEEGDDKEVFFQKNKEFYNIILPTAKENNVNILIENTTKENIRNRYFFLTGEDMKQFICEINHPNLHACWDTGHANVENHQYRDILALGDDLYALHINDNRGRADEHTIPYLGTMSLDEIMCGLADSGYKGYFTFECGMSVISGKRGWPYPKRLWDKSEKLLFAPQFIYEDLEKLLYKTGKYILKTYDMFEE